MMVTEKKRKKRYVAIGLSWLKTTSVSCSMVRLLQNQNQYNLFLTTDSKTVD